MNAGDFLAQSRTVRSLRARADRIAEQIAGQVPTLLDDNGVLLARLRVGYGDVELYRPLMSLRESVRLARWVLAVREQVRQSSRKVRRTAARRAAPEVLEALEGVRAAPPPRCTRSLRV